MPRRRYPRTCRLERQPGPRLLPEEHVADPCRARSRRPRLAQERRHDSEHVPRVPLRRLGYTTVMERRSPAPARQAHRAGRHAIIDAGCFVLLGNDDYLLRQLRGRVDTRARVRRVAARVTRAYAIKIVNREASRAGRPGRRAQRERIDDPVGSSSVTPRKILERSPAPPTPRAAAPVHIHCKTWPAGDVATTLATMRALAGQRAHFTHLQFHSYAGAGKGGRRPRET